MTGGLIGVIFGLVFIEANSGQLPHAWQAAVRVGGALLGAVLIAALSRARRTAPPRTGSERSSRPRFGRGYWAVVAAEVVALLAGLFVINNVIGAHKLSVAWIVLIVGIHFFGLGVVWKAAVFHVLGSVLTLLGVAGCVIYAVGGAAWLVALVSGVAAGLVLYAAAANWLIFGTR
jgi:hypothetical protein